MGRSAMPIFAARRVCAVMLRYGAAAISVGAALATALVLRHYDLPHPFTSFSFAAIAITSWYAGTGPGLLALLLSYSARSYFSIPATVGHSASESYLVVYGMFGVFVSWFSSSRRRAERLLTQARDDLEIRVVQRTAELTTVNQELQSMQSDFAGIGLPDPESGRLRVHALVRASDGSLTEQELLTTQNAVLLRVF